jgi:predicted acylesterase/phospholipase RssA
MLRKALFLALPLLLLAPSAGRAALYSEPDCDDDLLPQVLNVGLPYARDLLDIRYEAVQKSARELFEGLYRAHAPCGSRQRLQVNLAIGNDYQILDWLGRGLVDVAVVPTLSVYLLQKDGVELRELSPGGKVGDFLVPSWEPWLRSREAAGGAWRERDDPEGDFGAFRQALWCGLFTDRPERLSTDERGRCAGLSRAGYRMVLPSHLSTAGFLVPVSVVNTWLEGRLASLDPRPEEGEKTRLREDFWKAFFRDTRFTLGEDERDAEVDPPGLIEVRADIGAPPARGVPLGPASRDHLVIAGRAANAIFQNGRFPAPQAGLPEDLRAVLEAEAPPRAFASLLEVEPYFGVRTFGFTVEETIGLLRQHQRTSRRSRLALLLPGGGVKAAYQSRLVDELYRERYLKNVLTKGEAGGRSPLDVDFVVGTSGGALIGYFVARLAENGPWNLSKVLWEKKEDGVDRVLDSTDIFGWLDLPRYVSVLMIFLTFAALLTIVSTPHRPWLRTDLPPERGAWRLRLALTLWPLLLLVPVLVRVVNGRSSQEHIPEIEGLFYALCASTVLFADQCLILRTGEEKERERPPVSPLLLALPGAVLVAVPLLPVWGPEGERWTDRTVSFAAVHWGAFLVCLGCLCLLGAAVLWVSSARHYRLEGGRAFWSGFSLSLFHVFAVYVVLILAMVLRPGLISPLELTGGFWAWLMPVALVLGGLLVWLGCAGKGRAGRSVHKSLKFLCSHHPNGSLVSRRFLRISVVLVICLGWWNFILAPGVYGNKHARAFLEGAVARFEEEHRKENPRGNPHRLTAQLLVPANVLQRDGTRYFLVVPEDLPECPSIAREPGSGASWHQYRLRAGGRRPAAPESCPGVVGVGPADVGAVVFASGSPFPVFPAHFVPVQGVEGQPKEEALVDGGYTSNIPVDAARTIAAEQVLIVESQNPLGHGVSEAAAGAGFGLPGPGPLLAGLFQLPGFLFERSQQVDRLSKRNLFVVSLSPSREESDWPFLVDFRQSTVERMRQVAEADLSRRIGLVESWGPPRFQLSVLVGGGGG